MNSGISPNIAPLDRLMPEDESRSGAKAYNCARLKQAGFRVPDGLVVLSSAVPDDVSAVADHPWFDGLPADAAFAVRSSGIGEDGQGESFAGIHQTFLNVRRADIPAAIAACQASAHSLQALEYRRAKSIATDAIQMAVLVQRMIHPVAAGVAFTVNPVTGADDEIVINASWGVGEALVSGQVNPDEFVVRKDDSGLLWSRVGNKANNADAVDDDARRGSTMLSLSPNQVRELADILIGIENLYGAPQDVEWCHDGTDFWVVQSRPVTTDYGRSGETEWTRANLAEVMPDMTSPQVLATFEDLLNRAERLFLGGLLAPDQELGPMLKTFGGRLYFNLSQLRRVCALGGMPAADMLRSMGHADAIQPSDEKPMPVPLATRLSCIPDFIRLVWRHLRAAHIVRKHDETMQRILIRLAAADPRHLSDEDLWAAIEQWMGEAPEAMQTVLMLGGVVIHEAPVRKVCAKVGFPFEQLVYPQLAAGERSVSAQQAYDLTALAATARREPDVVRYLSAELADAAEMRVVLRGTAFLAQFERFLQAYGHRGRYESDWALPRYSEDPTPLLRALRAHLEDPSDRNDMETGQRQQRESADAWAAFADRLSLWQQWTILPLIRQLVQRIKRSYVWRERVRSDGMRVVAAMRTWHLVLAGRFVERGWLDDRDEYFLLHLDEIARVIKGESGPDGLRALVHDRTAETTRQRGIKMPLLMRESQLGRLIRTSGVSSRPADDSQLTGHPVSRGCVEAEVVVVLDPGDFGRMKQGAILVAPATDPSWTPLFTLASGVIVEVGGVLSHASTIAREYGLPALANVKDATKRLRTGERVRLDAINGVVYRLEQPLATPGTDLAIVG